MSGIAALNSSAPRVVQPWWPPRRVAHRLAGVYQPQLVTTIGRCPPGCRRVRLDLRDRLDPPTGP